MTGWMYVGRVVSSTVGWKCRVIVNRVLIGQFPARREIRNPRLFGNRYSPCSGGWVLGFVVAELHACVGGLKLGVRGAGYTAFDWPDLKWYLFTSKLHDRPKVSPST